MALDVLLVVAGLVVLARASDMFVVGAARLASDLGVSPVVVGAVVVGFGTSVPELLVSGLAASRGELDVALGNVIGSNLANLTLVLGIGGILARPETVPRVLRLEAPLSFAAVVALAIAVQDGLTRVEGLVLVAAVVVAVAAMVRFTEEPDTTLADILAEEELLEEIEELIDEGEAGAAPPPGLTEPRVRRDISRTLLGLLLTVTGAQLLVVGATSIAEDLGLSGGFVGLTLVAVGTSLPELVTAVQSARRGETALLIGNVLGSNVFNSLAVAGAAGLIGPAVIDDPALTTLAAGSMVLVAALAWAFLAVGRHLERWQALVLLGVYAATIPLTA